MLLTVDKISKSFGADILLKDVSFVVNAQDRVGVIGYNGAGKTTLIKMLIGQLKHDAGDISFAKNTNIGYLEQNSALSDSNTVYEEMKTVYKHALKAQSEIKSINLQLEQTPNDKKLLSKLDELSAITDAADIYSIDTNIKKVLNGMAFSQSEHEKKVSVLSGGEHTRLCLAKLLLKKPDVLFLDEPTNHLDFKTMQWLENYLQNYAGAVFVISHDRFFLDKVCNRIIEVEHTNANIYKGNYSAYTVQKEENDTLLLKKHEADVQKAAKLEDYIARNLVRASTTKMAQSRRKQLEKLQIAEKPNSQIKQLKFEFEFDALPYKDVLQAKNISKNLGGKQLVNDFNFEILRGERIVVAGENGTGKSTLLRILTGALKPDSGSVKMGAGVKMSVFEQQQLMRGGTVLSTIWNKKPSFDNFGARSYLARFNFKSEEVDKPCNTLSGGELARLRLAEMVLERPNVIFMDEPTNHLDIYTREFLGEALCAFEGTIVIVTHDRYLMNQLNCPILYIENEDITKYKGYEDLMNAQNNVQMNVKADESIAPIKQNAKKENRKRKAQLREQISTLEERLNYLEKNIEELEKQINEPEILKDHVILNEKCELLEQKRAEHEEVFLNWDMLIDEQKEYAD